MYSEENKITKVHFLENMTVVVRHFIFTYNPFIQEVCIVLFITPLCTYM